MTRKEIAQIIESMGMRLDTAHWNNGSWILFVEVTRLRVFPICCEDNESSLRAALAKHQ
jgi:hypothetical protein